MRAQRGRAEGGEALGPLRTVAGAAEHRRAEVAAALAAQETVGRYREARERGAVTEEEHAAAAERFLTLKAAWLAPRQPRRGQSAEGPAGRREAGRPCPVCGSAEHPAPATAPTGERMGPDQEQEARRLQSDAEARLQGGREERDRVRLEVAALAARGGDVEPDVAAEVVRTGVAALEEAERAVADCATLEARMRQGAAEEERIGLLRESLREQHHTAGARRSSLQDQEAVLTARLDGLRAGAASLAERIDRVQQAHDDLESARDSLEALVRCTSHRDEAGAHLEQALLASAFATAEDARAALLPESRHADLLSSAKEHELRGHRLDAAWEDSAVRAALDEERDGLEPPTDDDVRRAAAYAEQRRTLAHRADVRSEVLGHSVERVAELARQLAELEEEVAPLRERSALVAAVADTARGGGENLYKMSLATYVLASRLEQVAAAATERLLQMSDGRYALVHSDATAGNRRSGLGLDVIDGWTGNRRGTSTLSGGGSFMASLALALGLADVVQQEAGGLDIETLFVDEGFGSLDDQALEQVMDALEGLRSGGRVVGLVSHVAELKQRVGVQLQVLKGRQGSTLHFVEQPTGV
ncbi:SbcC/MukB-like Walker B domain-containing protein [Arthrobacter sp. RIT-PI-e]|uniref:SbcC/MukB-like Walker B domain-containing protein n=1 Tax=Arthrobacter sp. RIT-PI-e TaxID=1681197 RepID=UPI000676207A